MSPVRAETLSRELRRCMSAKRVMDVVLTAPAAVALLPLFLALAIGIKLDSPGPVFYRQVRVGRYGKPFRVWKFRSMVWHEADPGSKITVAGDARITPFGQFLRKYKLDELPQLFNVLVGEMSLVGPRPEVPEYVEYYPEPARSIVLSVSPGITDNASLEFRDENELLRSEEDPERVYREQILPRKLAIYQRYVSQRTLIGDLRLVCRTVLAVFRVGRTQ